MGMTLVRTEAVQVSLALETLFSVQPTTDWVRVQPNPNGIKGWMNKYVNVERDPLSLDATMEAGTPVGFDATPELEIDLTKDLLDVIASPMFRSVAKHNGNTGLSLFRPTAVTSTHYVVAALGALTAGLIVNAQGLLVAGNNGPKIVGAASTATTIPTTGLAAETVDATQGATLEVCGVQGASGDIEIDSNGDLISTVLDFTTLGLQRYQWIKIGGPSTTAATRFATSAYNDSAQITGVITANKIPLGRRGWTVGAADPGTGKTIWILFGRWYRNVRLDHPTDYLEPTFTGELTKLGQGAGGAATYTYAAGMATKTVKLSMPLKSKITASLSFCADDVQDPVLVASRATGADVPRRPMAAALWHTSSPQTRRCRLIRLADSFTLAAEVNSCTFTMEHEVKPREILGGLGAEDMIYGKYKPSAQMEIYPTTSEVAAALRANPDVAWDYQVRNANGGWILDMPFVRIRGGEETFAAASAVMASLEVPGFREPTTNIVASLTVFPYWPE